MLQGVEDDEIENDEHDENEKEDPYHTCHRLCGAREGREERRGVLDLSHQPRNYSFTGIQLGSGRLVDVWQLGAARVDFNLTF